jgi:hypothetical protein
MESYENEYQAVKASRKLFWRPALGTVEVELEGPHGAHTFTVSPLQAAVIYLFQEQGRHRLFGRTFVLLLNIYLPHRNVDNRRAGQQARHWLRGGQEGSRVLGR